MSLVVETGSGSDRAESYVTLAEIDAHLDGLGIAASWRSALTTEQEVIARKATRYLERAYGHRWRGYRATLEQALDWPRASVTDADGRAISSDEIPASLKRACMEAARRILAGTDLLADVESTGTVKRERVKGGSAEVETEYATPAGGTGATQAQRYTEIELEIRRLLRPGGRVRKA